MPKTYMIEAMVHAESFPISLLTGPTISIFTGPERKQWTLHLKLLAHQSPFFASRTESDDDQLEYLDDNPLGWSLLVAYFYRSSLPPLSDFRSPNTKYEHAVACHSLYILCFRFSIPALANLAIDRLRRCLHTAHLVPDADEIHEMYNSSPEGSGMRNLMIRIAARQIMDPEVERDVQAYFGCFEKSPEFAVGLVREIRRLSGGVLFGNPNAGSGCEYHEHAEGEACDGVGEGEVNTGVSQLLFLATTDVGESSQSPEADRKSVCLAYALQRIAIKSVALEIKHRSIALMVALQECIALRYNDDSAGNSYIMLTWISSFRFVPINMSTGNQTPERLSSKALLTASNTETSISTYTRADSTNPKRKVPIPRKPGEHGKLNGTGLKVHFVDPLKSAHFPRPTDKSILYMSSADPRSNQAVISTISISSEPENANESNETSSHRPRRTPTQQARLIKGQTDKEKDLSRPAEGTCPTSPNPKGRNVKGRAASSEARNGRVDNIVSQYDQLMLYGSALRPQEDLASGKTVRRRPPKLRLSVAHDVHQISEEFLARV